MPTFPLGRDAGAAALGGLEMRHGQQHHSYILLALTASPCAEICQVTYFAWVKLPVRFVFGSVLFRHISKRWELNALLTKPVLLYRRCVVLRVRTIATQLWFAARCSLAFSRHPRATHRRLRVLLKIHDSCHRKTSYSKQFFIKTKVSW